MAFRSRWSARAKALWPHVRVVRVFGTDGSSSWEVHLVPRRADIVVPEPRPKPVRKPAAPPSAAPPPAPAPTTQTWPAPERPATDLPRRPAPAESGRERLPRPSPYSQPAQAPPNRFRAPPGRAATAAPVPPVPEVVDLFQPATPPEGLPAATEPAPVPLPAGPAAARPLPAYTWVQLRSGPGHGDQGREVNRYMVTIRASIDLGPALREPDVGAALRRLSHDPADRLRRDDVVTELAAVPSSSRFTTTIFDLSTLHTDGAEAFLDGLLVIRNQGVQVGEQGGRPHHLTYVTTPTAEATRLLELNPRLAGALVDHLCPSPSGTGEGDQLDRLLRTARAGQEQPPNGQPRLLRLSAWERGTVLRIEHLDAGSDPATGARRVQVDRLLDDPEPLTSRNGSTPANGVHRSHLNGSAPVNGSTPPILEQRQAGEPAPDDPDRPEIDDPDRILELDSRTLDLHPSLGQYLAALSDHIGYEVGTRPEVDPERDDDHDHGVTGR